MSGPLLSVRDLRVAFVTEAGRVQAVDGVSFDLAAGEVLAVVGESGAGKSVTAQTIVGLTRSSNARIEGSARLEGAELIGADERRLQAVRGSRIAMVFQNPMASLNPVYRIGAQIVEAIRAHRPGIGDAEARTAAIEALDSVGIAAPERRIDSYPHEFSGGMRQRAMIAMALALEPEVLIADEPTTALDVTIQAGILALLSSLNRERNLATLLVTHDLGVVADVADRVAVMRNGRIVEQAGLDQVFYAPKERYTRSLIGAVIRLDRPAPQRPVSEGAPLLEVTDLVKRFPARGRLLRGGGEERAAAVDGVSLRIRGGETLGLVGESGSGKSTLCRTVLRLLEPTSGSIRFGGREIARLSQRQLRPLRQQMQIVFQDPDASLNPRRRIGQVVADPLRLHGTAGGAELRREVASLLERVGLAPEHADRYPHEFSGGQRQRIGIARALALRPKLIVADEPVSALDVTIRAQILELLAELQEELGLCYLFVAHDIGVVRHVADRIAVMKDGKIVEEGAAEQVCKRPVHPYTRELIGAVPVPDPRAARARQTVGT